MSKSKREPRKRKSKKIDLLIPVDLSDIGTDQDPCFGKLYDLLAPECKVCGDSELCQLHHQQHLSIKRLSMEKSHTFKDVEDNKVVDHKKVKKYYTSRIDYHGNKGKATRETAKQFGIDKSQVKQITK